MKLIDRALEIVRKGKSEIVLNEEDRLTLERQIFAADIDIVNELDALDIYYTELRL